LAVCIIYITNAICS